MNTKTDVPKKIVAEIQKEITGKQTLGDAELERNTERAKALLQWLNEERERRAVERVAQTAAPGSRAGPPGQQADVGKLPKRDAIVLALETVGVASSPARIKALAIELFAVTVSTSQFASFRKADERSYRRNPRTRTYILPALSAVDLGGLSGTVTLSTWPLERRILAGYSQRVDGLRALGAAYMAYRESKDPAAAAVMRVIGHEFPIVSKYAPNYDAMAEVAGAEIERLGARDAEERGAAAERATHLDRLSQLFGRSPLLVVGAG
jgi:hypothetical protein